MYPRLFGEAISRMHVNQQDTGPAHCFGGKSSELSGLCSTRPGRDTEGFSQEGSGTNLNCLLVVALKYGQQHATIKTFIVL